MELDNLVKSLHRILSWTRANVFKKRPRKCPGCKRVHEDHSFQANLVHSALGPMTHYRQLITLLDEERELTAQLEKLKMAELSLATESRIHKLKLEIAESQRRIEELGRLGRE